MLKAVTLRHWFAMLLIVTSVVAAYWALEKPSQLAPTTGVPPPVSYYHWANTYTDNPTLLRTYQPKKLYVKLLDIGYREQALNINPTDMRTPPSIPFIPVVFLDNEALKNASLDTLYAQILTHIPPKTYTHLQVDCDWTEQTRETYFGFLKQLQTDYPQLSVTLRLHQIKYASRTGVPPVQRAVLMYYNMSDIRDTHTNNYILDNKVGKAYLSNFADYPLPLDLALPLYQQTRVIRQGKLVQLINGAEVNSEKTAKIDEQHYRVTQGHYWQEYYLYPDDELRIDAVDNQALQQSAELLATIIHPSEIIFYTLNDATRFKPQELIAIAKPFTSRSKPE